MTIAHLHISMHAAQHTMKQPSLHFFKLLYLSGVICLRRGVKYRSRSEHKKELKCNVCKGPKRKLTLSSDLDLSTVWLQPMCLALLKTYCTVCHSSRCGLTSPTVKTTGSRPGLPAAERQGWKLLQKWVYSIHPTNPRGLPARAPGSGPTSSSKFGVFRSHTHLTLL